jgi:hypothetical protein
MTDKIRGPQYADNWAFLHHPCLPTNVDGLFHMIQSDKFDRFLFIEVKRGEPTSEGQNRMLLGLSRQPAFTVLVLYSKYAKPDIRHLQDVIPFFYRALRNQEEGKLVMTSPEDFARRHRQWFEGKNPF